MISLHTDTGVMRMNLRSVVEPGEMKDAHDLGLRCLDEEAVEALVIDIRGCKPIGPECLADLKDLYGEARERGVSRFVRIGDGTLCAMQMHALERETRVSEHTEVYRGHDLP